MQTFLPYPSVADSLMVLDWRRLGKQRGEAKQILNAIYFGGGWANHSATRMWREYPLGLGMYGWMACEEWKSRGYNDATQPFFEEYLKSNDAFLRNDIWPWWIGDEAFHASHRSNLLRKDPEHYGQFGWEEPDDLPYVWPTPHPPTERLSGTASA